MDGTGASISPLPRTIPEAVDFLIARMPASTQSVLLRFTDETDLLVEIARGVVPGINVRAMLGLWDQNSELLNDLPRRARHPDDASGFLLIECWRRLRARS